MQVKKKKEKGAPPDGNARKGTTFWLMIVFLVSAWMFLLGILVGRERAPVHFDIGALQKELAALKEAVLQKEQKRYKIRAQKGKDKPDLEFHEALKAPKVKARIGPDAGRSLKQTTSGKTAAALKKKTVAPEKPSTSGDSRNSGSAAVGRTDELDGGFTLQVASLKELSLADAMVAKLKQKGYPAYRTMGVLPGKGVWYRVRIGKFKSRTDAERMLGRVKKDKLNGIVVQK